MATLLMPICGSVLTRMAPAPVTTRSISRVSDGTMSAIGVHHDGNAADHPVALGLDREQPATGRRLLDRGDIAQQRREGDEVRLRIAAERGEAGLHLRGGVRVLGDEAEAGLPGDDARARDRLAEQLIAARQLAQFRAGLVVEAAEALGRDVRRGPIRLGEDHVEGDGDAAERGQARDEIGHDRARPGPLADPLEALLVDVDDHDRPQRRLPRLERLVEVEAPEPQPFEQGRVPHPQHDEVEQQHEADGAADAEPVEKAEEALHGPETGFFPNSLTDPTAGEPSTRRSLKWRSRVGKASRERTQSRRLGSFCQNRALA